MSELVWQLAQVLDGVGVVLVTFVRPSVYREDVRRCDLFAEACHEAAETLRRAVHRAAKVR